jgi:hypothetical protein
MRGVVKGHRGEDPGPVTAPRYAFRQTYTHGAVAQGGDEKNERTPVLLAEWNGRWLQDVQRAHGECPGYGTHW